MLTLRSDHPNCSQEGAPYAKSLDGSGSVFASSTNTRELATVGGVTPPIHYHALLAETGQRIARFREFILFHGEFVYPEYLLAYQRAGEGGEAVG